MGGKGVGYGMILVIWSVRDPRTWECVVVRVLGRLMGICRGCVVWKCSVCGGLGFALRRNLARGLSVR